MLEWCRNNDKQWAKKFENKENELNLMNYIDEWYKENIIYL